MAIKIEIIGNYLQCLDTVSGKIVISEPFKSTWYKESDLQIGRIIFYDKDGIGGDLAITKNFPVINISDAVDGGLVSFTEATFRSFAVSSLGASGVHDVIVADYNYIIDDQFSVVSQKILEDSSVDPFIMPNNSSVVDVRGVLLYNGSSLRFNLKEGKRYIITLMMKYTTASFRTTMLLRLKEIGVSNTISTSSITTSIPNPDVPVSCDFHVKTVTNSQSANGLELEFTYGAGSPFYSLSTGIYDIEYLIREI